MLQQYKTKPFKTKKMRTTSSEVLEMLEKRNAQIRADFSKLKESTNARDAIAQLAPKYNLSASSINLIVYPRAMRSRNKGKKQ